MNKLFPLSKDRYGDKYWQRASNWHFAADKALVPIVSLELPRAVGEMPLAFAPHKDSWILVGVLGTESALSLAVDGNGSWRPGHYPALLATYPFVLVDGKDENQVVAVDEGSGLITDDPASGEPFFHASGEPAKGVQEVVNHLKRVAASRMATRRAVQAITDADLLEPWEISIPLPSGARKLEGLYYASEARLRKKDPETLKSLLDTGALVIFFGQLLSMFQITRLSRWAKEEDAGTPKEIADINLDALFGKDDILRFD